MPIVFANDGAGSGLDPDLLDGAHAATFQVRVTGLCPSGDTLQGINADGSVVCLELPRALAITTVDDAVNNFGEWTSIAIGTDGFPVVSYSDGYAGALKVAKCTNRSCRN